MPLDPLPGQLVVPTRSQSRDLILRDWGIRNPAAVLTTGGEPYLKASIFADAVVPLYANAVAIAKNTSRSTMTGVALDNEAQSLGTQRLGAVGASGSVTIGASSGGTKIFAGDLLTIGAFTYQCLQTAIYQDQAPVPIQGVSTGPATDQDPGTIGQWQIPRPGSAASCTVTTQTDGTGLDDGHDAETDDQLRQRLNYIAANPPASGNDAEIQELALRCPGLFLEQVFTYPAALGPSSTCVVFTLSATQSGGNRIPNSTQIGLMQAWLQAPGNLPADLTILVGTLVPQNVSVVLLPDWVAGVAGWIDAQPFPPYTSPDAQIAAPTTGTTSPTYFRIINTVASPQVGQNLALYDAPNQTFRRKKVLTVASDGGGGYDVTVDTTNSISDTSYTPNVGQYVSPWSDSLDTLVPPVVAYMSTLGPGEQFSSFPDPGSRQHRNPVSPGSYPNVLSARILAGPSTQPFVPVGQTPPAPLPTLATTPALLDVTVQEPSLPFATSTGFPGVGSYMQVLGDLAAYP
jgi:hypothetical protein